MEKVKESLIKENCYMKSRIEGLSDLLWSMGVRCITYNIEDLIKWFNSPIPAFDNRIPLDILKEDGEEELFGYMQTIPC